MNGYALIGFGYAGGTQQPGYFGFQETTLASQEKGDFVWGLRDVVTDTLPTERMRLTSAGNLGLGTTTPGSKLVVNGNIDIGTTTTSAAGQITQNGTRLLHTYGTSNLFMGANAGNFTTTGTLNSSYGAGTLQYLTSASENNAFGYSALANTTSGSSNMAMGSSALYSNTTGTRNTAIGRAAMYYNTDSGDNVAIGYNVLFNTGGFGANTVIGTSAMFNATGNLLENTVIGYNSLLNANGARYNTVIGSSGGNAVTSGFYNTIIGRGSGSNITTGSSNIIIGDRVDAPSATASNQLNIGNIIFGTSIDGTGTTISTGNVGIGTTTPAARFQVTGAGGTNPFRVASSTNVSMLEITQAGNVGIGTTAPGAKLQIGESTGTVPTNTNLFIEGGKSLRFGSNNGNADYGTYMRSDYLANAALVFGTRELGVDTDTFTLTNGRLGIGTTNPTTPLEISNPGANYDTLRLSNTASGGYRRQGIILQHGNDSEESVVTLQAYTAADNSDNTLFWGGGSSLYNTVTTQRFYTAANGNTLTGSERMRITGDGNIGIGTTTPSHNLTIAGNINFTGSLYQNGTAFSSAGNSAFTFGNGFIYNATSTDLVGIGSSTPISTLSVKGKGGVNPFTISSSTNAILFNVTQAGNVGIGTSTPGSLLTLGSGQFSVPKGTSTLPSITFGGETSSGFYGITGQANSVAYSYAGVEAFRFDGNGLGVPKPSTNRRYITTFDSVSGSTAWSVGSNATEDYFGFTNPNNDGSGFFHSGSTGNVEYRYQAYSLANLGIVFRDDANTFYVRANSGTQSGNLQEWRNSSDVALSVVGPTGNFGIGTTTPSARLAVTGIAGTGDIFAIASSTEARLLTVTSAGNVGIGTTTPGFLLTLATTASAPLQLRSTNTRTFIRFDNNTATTRYLGLNSSGNMVFYGSDSVTENMVVTNAGNVAIGTTTPATKLNVWGTGEAARFGDNTNTSTYLGFAYNSVSGSPRGFFGHDSGRGNTVVQAGSTKGIEFNVNNDTFGSGYVMSIKSTGDIGIGTTTPVAKLAITGTTGSSTDLFTVASSTNSRLFTITAAGRVGIGTTTPGAQLTTTGTVQFSGLGGAGAVTSDAVGNLTTASDERLKDIEGDFTRGLEDIKKINPISYHWKTETGYDTSNLYSGFSAQNVQLAIPEAVLPNSQGYLSLQERPILAAAINAIKELASVFSKIEDGIAYVKTIVVERFTIGSSEKPAGITIYDQATGAPYCIQVVNGTMVNVSGACGITSSAPSSSSTDTTTGGGDQLVIDNSDTSLVASSTPTEDIPVETDVISEEDNTPETPSAESAPVPEPAETLEPAPEQVSAPIADSTPSNPPADTGSTI
ncbi:MAG: tail fiber domain-containing protein [Patescibacteria group bacterium]